MRKQFFVTNEVTGQTVKEECINNQEIEICNNSEGLFFSEKKEEIKDNDMSTYKPPQYFFNGDK